MSDPDESLRRQQRENKREKAIRRLVDEGRGLDACDIADELGEDYATIMPIVQRLLREGVLAQEDRP